MLETEEVKRMKLYVKKVLNNNVLWVTSENKQEQIVMEKGIGWHLQPKSIILSNDERIDQVFIVDNDSYASTFQEMLKRVNISDIKLANHIIKAGEKELGYKCSKNILFSLSDHISFMLERIRNNEEFANPLEWDIKTIYAKEYQYSLKAVDYLRKETQLEIPDQEAAFVALHFINSHYDSDNMHETLEVTKIIQNVIDIVNYHYGKEFAQDSYTFSRFIVHLRYFILRQLHSEKDNTGASLIEIIKIKYPNDYECAQKIKDFLENTYHWDIEDGELLYLTLHLNRLSSTN